MSWLVPYVVGSIVAAFLVVRIFDYIFSGVVNSLTHAVRAGLFVGVGTVVTTASGMRAFSKRVRQWRQQIGRKKEIP